MGCKVWIEGYLSVSYTHLDAAGEDLGETIGAIVDASYKLMAAVRPDALLVLGDTNSCLSVIPAKRLHIPIFHMEAGNRCKDERLDVYKRQGDIRKIDRHKRRAYLDVTLFGRTVPASVGLEVVRKTA